MATAKGGRFRMKAGQTQRMNCLQQTVLRFLAMLKI